MSHTLNSDSLSLQEHPIVVGIIGGIASGKSEVARILVEHGALHVNADAIGHELLQTSEVKSLVQDAFGDSVMEENGDISRIALAKAIFDVDSEKAHAAKHKLEQILHPRIRSKAEQQIADAKQNRSHPLIVLDAPLLLEANWKEMCDRIIFVDTPWSKRREFVQQRKWTDEELRRREATQLPLEVKRREATDIIVNNGTIRDLKSQVLGLPWLAQLSARRSCD